MHVHLQEVLADSENTSPESQAASLVAELSARADEDADMGGDDESVNP